MSFDQRLQQAVQSHRDGDLDAAEAAYAAILAEQPQQPDALHFLGVLHFARGDAQGALDLIGRSLAACPANPAAQTNLGNVLKESGRLDEAAQAYMAALRVDPGHADAWANLGVMLRRAGELEKSLEVLEEAVRLAPDHAEAWHNLGLARLMTGSKEDAANAFETCVGLGSRRWSNPVWQGALLAALGRQDLAQSLFRRALEANPANALARHHLAALTGSAPARASDEFVRTHFDAFADNFDEVLGWLEYRAPEAVAEAVARRANGATLAEVVDLGCGTGLCGPLIRERCGRLSGVDLSPNMLRQAAGRGVYDRLFEGELVAFLRAMPDALDLAVSADVLIYLGALEPLMEALARALKPGGALIATVELLEDGAATGYRIDQSGRYMHSLDYIAGAAGGAGLRLLRADPLVLRKELDRQVQGVLFEVERPVGHS